MPFLGGWLRKINNLAQIKQINMETTSFQPTGKTILIKPDPIETKTESGIIIPIGAEEKPLTGTIVAVSVYSENVGFSIGDRILYRRYRDHDVKVAGEALKIIEDIEENVFGIFK